MALLFRCTDPSAGDLVEMQMRILGFWDGAGDACFLGDHTLNSEALEHSRIYMRPWSVAHAGVINIPATVPLGWASQCGLKSQVCAVAVRATKAQCSLDVSLNLK